MEINRLSLKNYRNYADETIEFSSGINILYGNNAQGKTNVLESIFVCATTKSHRTAHDKEMIAYNQPYSKITCEFEKDLGNGKIEYYLKSNEKNSILIHGIPIKKKSELLGQMNVVMFSPEDLGLIKQTPALRRSFMDSELCQLNPLYFYHLQRYQYFLKQRNNCLKNYGNSNDFMGMIEVLNDQLINHGKEIINYRNAFIERMNQIIRQIHYDISGKKEIIELKYHPNCEVHMYEKELIKSFDNDKRFKSTSVGPHKDDLIFMINNNDLKKYGSQGQQRTAALSLKIAEIEIVKETIREYPILLLDDVLSELDAYRQGYLMERIDSIQTLITCTGVEDIISKNNERINRQFLVELGTITQKK